MISLLTSWLRREGHSGRRSRRLPAARKPWLELLESRTVLSSWTTVAPMPTARFWLAAAPGTDGRIYAIGGEDFTGKPLNTVEAYDPGSNTWTTVAPLPTARQVLAAAGGADGRIYAIGGVGGANDYYLHTVEAYNPGSNSWSTVAPLPTARGFLAAAAGADGRIYAIGGYNPNNGGLLNTVEAYDPSSNSWTAVASMPTARGDLAAAAGADGSIYATGGGSVDGPLNTVEAYHLGTNSWSTVASMPTARSALAAVAGGDGRVYAIGGYNGGALSTVEAYGPSVDITILGNHILQLVATSNLPTNLVVTDDRHWGINVILDGRSVGTFHGIDRVEIHTGGGADSVRYAVAGGTGRPADLMVDLGTGTDTFSLSALPAVQDLGSGRPWQIDVHTSGGNDQVRADIQGLVPVRMMVALGDGTNSVDLAFDQIQHLPVGSDVTVQGGAGNDNIAVTASFKPESDPPASPRAGNGPLKVTVNGGLGDDDIRVIYGFNPQPDPPARGIHFNTPLFTSVDGGPGNDDIRVIYGFNPQPDPPALPVNFDAPISASINGGPGDDNIADIFSFNPQPDPPATPSVNINAPITLETHGGDGADSIESIVGFNPQPDPPAFSAVNINAPLTVNTDGGDGPDDIRVIYGFNPQPDPPATPPLVGIHAAVTLNVNGGGGGDSIAARVGFNPQPDPPASPILVNLLGSGGGANRIGFDATGRLDGALQLGLLGGNDSDLVDLHFMLDPASRGSVGANVMTGAGNDHLMAAFNSSLIGLMFNADLGAGDDTFAGQFMPTALRGAAGDPTVNVFGGDGNDVVSLVVGNPDAITNDHFAVPLRVNLDGGAGDDALAVTYQHVILDAAQTVNVNGGAGNDTIKVQFFIDSQSSGALDVLVAGGAGDDDLTLTIYFVKPDGTMTGDGQGQLRSLAALIDGGAGFDTAHHTANVRVINCER
jgi:N-acetylneuraminic acid mutarotase